MALMQISDVGRTFTAYADEAISAGMFVKATSSNDVVTASGLSSFVAKDIAVSKMDAATDDELVVGIALETASSGGTVTVATEGIFILPAQDAIGAGKAISPSNDADAFANSVTTVNDGEEEFQIGHALTGASASGTYLVALVRL